MLYYTIKKLEVIGGQGGARLWSKVRVWLFLQGTQYIHTTPMGVKGVETGHDDLCRLSAATKHPADADWHIGGPCSDVTPRTNSYAKLHQTPRRCISNSDLS